MTKNGQIGLGREDLSRVIYELRHRGGNKPISFRKWKTLHIAEYYSWDIVGDREGEAQIAVRLYEARNAKVKV